MRNYLLLLTCVGGLLSAPACSSKKDNPTPYADFAPVSSTLAVSMNGAASYNLSNLELKIQKNSSNTSDIYLFRGIYNGRQGVQVYFFVDPKRTGTGPWPSSVSVSVNGVDYKGAQTASDLDSNGSFSANGSTFSGRFSGQTISGSIR